MKLHHGPNLCQMTRYNESTTAILIDLYSAEYKLKTLKWYFNTGLSYGVECIIFKEIATRLNITWDTFTSDDKDKWGTVWMNNTITGGALKWLYTKRVDVSFCSLWIDHIKSKFVDMSKFWTLTCLKFLVPKPLPLREKWDLLFKPFPLSLWLLVLFSATLTTITIWILAGIQKKIGYANINGWYLRNYVTYRFILMLPIEFIHRYIQIFLY